ncbi:MULTISPECIES: SMP-30/gluconolactonase/LRE family protein [unclassified Mycobacterium]|uniref:SMP-30/gluconolactonase/LRE family protein n=1 Tax=unclassified Mycobacterium TaxID=2642494 RepID=UPI0009ED0C59|nr:MULTISPECIES: SMP-30/gluconolactonase/LRE family protein [unclassified Mycobacterium]
MTQARRILKTGSWTPPPAPPEQGRTDRTAPFAITRRFPTGGEGPEDVIFDRDGLVLTGLADGSIVRIDPATGRRTLVGRTGGRPLGLQPGRDGSVLICDHDRGLLRMSPDGGVRVLVDHVAGAPLRFASNVVDGADGTIWFTVSSRRWDLQHYLGDVFEHSCTGLLVRLDADGVVTVLRDGLKFANGLALAPDESHLLFAETEGYRVSRYWLTGAKTSSVEPLVENLPGLPDNISLGSDGLIWVAVAAPRNALLDRLLPRPGFLRTVLWNLPTAVRPKATPIAWVMAFDLQGRLVHDLRSEDGSYDFVTSVAERNGVVVAGGLHASDIVQIRLPAS